MTDKQEIISALKLWFQPGDVFEIRVLDATSAEWSRPHMESGYFDYEHIPEAADAIGRLRSYRGAYATVNPVNPDLLARACNRIRGITREPTTADADIATRRWLLIDCDPKRVSGVSSSDSEHDAALSMVCKIRDGLALSGWPDPIVQDSGNGAQMMYPIDLPADDGGLVQRCIEGIATAGDEQVDVDLTVFNPARIWRIPGTMNCKGDNVPSRPHRMAKILSVPDRKGIVTAGQMEAAAAWKNTQPVAAAESAPVNSDFDLDSWIRRYCPELGEPQVWKDGRKWVFPVCPFNDAHRNRSAVLIQQSNGAIAFRCHHNSCTGNDWRRLRELREPGCYDRKEEKNLPDVDISGILNQKPRNKPQQEKTMEKSVSESIVPMPDELLNVPGFVSDVVAFDLKTAPCPNPVLALAGALALQAHLIGGKVCAPGGSRAAIYIVSLGKSGIGKEHPRKVNKAILNSIGIANTYAENVASGQALEDRIAVTNPLLWLCDEFHAVLNEVVQDTSGTKENLFKTLLSLYSSADTFVALRDKVGRTNQILNNPILNLYASCTPGKFYESINSNVMDHGMYSRMCLFSASPRHPNQLPGDVTQIPKNIFDRAKQWVNYQPPGSGNLGIACRTLSASEETQKLMKQFQNEAQEEYNRLDRIGAPEWQLTIWTRVYENMLRYAIVYACSQAATPEDAELTSEAIIWAKKLTFWEAKNKIALTNRFYYETDFARYSGIVLEVLTNWRKAYGDEPMPGYRFNRSMKQFPPKVLAAVIESLEAQERVEVIFNPGIGRSGKKYRLMPD